MEFRYSLEDAEGNTILSANPSLDDVVRYVDKNTTTATQYRVILVRNDRPNIVLYTQTEALPDLNDVSVRKVFNLDS